MKDYFDEQIKKQLQLMSGSEDDWSLELRQFPVTDVENPNFESVNIEKLKTLSIDKLPKLQ